MTSSRHVKVGFTKDTFPAGTHMCLIYDDDTARRSVIGKFLESGFLEGEKVAYFADTATPGEVRAWLEGMGVSIADEDAAFSVTVAEETYCPGGTFSPSAMLDTLRAYHSGALEEGYPGGRVSGEMSWALKGIPGSDRLMEYEALVNDVLATHPVTAICQYDARRFSGLSILDVLKVHPMMIVQGQIVRNPYFMRPEEFLQTRET